MKKNLTLLFIIFLLAILYAFRKAGAHPAPLPNIVGKWYFNEIVAVPYNNGNPGTAIVEKHFTVQDIANFETSTKGYICASDGDDTHQFIFKSGFNYNLDGGSLLLIGNAANSNCGNSGDSNGIFTVPVVTLTATNFTWRGANTATINGSTVTYVITYYLSRTPTPPTPFVR